jgi:hypothetical protein
MLVLFAGRLASFKCNLLNFILYHDVVNIYALDIYCIFIFRISTFMTLIPGF